MSTLQGEIRTLRLAAVQMVSQPGQLAANLERAATFAEQAARDGAQLVVLPELSASGYTLTRELWDMAERRDGPTSRWARQIAKKLSLYLGIGFVEADGEDFYNTYLLADPEGEIAGYVRKTNAETYFFRRAPGPHVVCTAIGKIGIGICADNQQTPMREQVPIWRQMQDAAIDLMLMPHAWPDAWRPTRASPERDMLQARQKMRMVAPLYAGLLGVPSAFVNQVGPLRNERWPGLMGRIIGENHENYRFLGLCTIADSDGAIAGQLAEGEEAVLVVNVTLDPARKRRDEPRTYGRYRWIHPGSPLRDLIIGIDLHRGIRWYERSAERKARARAVSAPSGTKHGQ